VSVSSSDTDALVVDWLNELLYRYEAEGFLPGDFHVSVDDGATSLTARCHGEPFDPERHGTLTAVKAATYHGLVVAHNHEWRIEVILDV
jgi:SHS2 domain-containing protein